MLTTVKKKAQVSPFSGPVTLAKTEGKVASSLPALEFKCRCWKLHLEHLSCLSLRYLLCKNVTACEKHLNV